MAPLICSAYDSSWVRWVRQMRKLFKILENMYSSSPSIFL